MFKNLFRLVDQISPYLIVLVLVLVPLYPKFPLVGVSGTFVSVRLEDFLLSFVIGIWVLFTLIRRKTTLTPLHKAIILYWFIGSIATFSGITLTKTTSLNLSLLHYLRRVEYMIMFFIGFDFISQLSHLKFIIRAVLLTSLIVALYGLGQQFFNLPVISTTNSEFAKGLALSLGPGARINSTFAGHYDLAAFSVFPLMLILALLTLPGRSKWLLLVPGFLIYWTLLLSASRITFASLFFCAGLLLIFARKKLWLVPLGIVAVVSIFITPQLKGRYLDFLTNHIKFTSIVQSVSAADSTVSAVPDSKDVNEVPDALKPSAVPEDRSFNIRLRASWPKAMRAFYKNPLVGTGFSSVGLAVDNDYLRILAETGLLGLASFGLIFLLFFKQTLPNVFRYQPNLKSAFFLGMAFSLLSLLINAVFIDIFEASKVAIFFWAMAGVTVKASKL